MCRLQEGSGFGAGPWYQEGFRIFKQDSWQAGYDPFTSKRKETQAPISQSLHDLLVPLSHPWMPRLAVRG